MKQLMLLMIIILNLFSPNKNKPLGLLSKKIKIFSKIISKLIGTFGMTLMMKKN